MPTEFTADHRLDGVVLTEKPELGGSAGELSPLTGTGYERFSREFRSFTDEAQGPLFPRYGTPSSTTPVPQFSNPAFGPGGGSIPRIGGGEDDGDGQEDPAPPFTLDPTILQVIDWSSTGLKQPELDQWVSLEDFRLHATDAVTSTCREFFVTRRADFVDENGDDGGLDLFLYDPGSIKLTELGLEYARKCFDHFPEAGDPVGMWDWAARRVGYISLHDGERLLLRCVITFVTNRKAVTAGHCRTNTAVGTTEKITIGGYRQTVDGRWEQWKQQGVYFGRSGPLDFRRLELDPTSLDFIELGPSGDPWPVSFSNKPDAFAWGAPEQARHQAAAFTWWDQGDLATGVPNRRLRLSADISVNCVVGTRLNPGDAAVGHGCQVIKSSSGTPIVYFDADRPSNGRVFAMHVEAGNTPANTAANTAIRVYQEFVDSDIPAIYKKRNQEALAAYRLELLARAGN